MSLRLVRAVLFDWDGTLVNSLPVKVLNAGDLFAQTFGLDRAQVQTAYRRHSGIPRRQLFNTILTECGRESLTEQDYLPLSEAFSQLNRAALSDASQPGLITPGAVQTLTALLERGCRLFVSSSAETAELRQVAQSLGLAGYFSRSGGDIFGSRPGFGKGREHVEYICAQHHLSEESLLFIGDDLADIRLGAQAGVFTVSLAGSLSPADLLAGGAQRVINSLPELLHLPGVQFGQEPEK